MPLPQGGISTQLNLPLPDLAGGAFAVTNISLHSRLDLLFAGRFTIRTAFWLSRPNRPFTITILFLSGGGWVGVEASYTPPREYMVSVTIGIAAGATAALNLGVATGIVQFLVRFSTEFITASGRSADGPRITMGLVTFGELRILGLISLYIGIGYELTYNASDGSLGGRGWLSVRIKICWCVKIRVEQSVSIRLAGGRPRSQSLQDNSEDRHRRNVNSELNSLATE